MFLSNLILQATNIMFLITVVPTGQQHNAFNQRGPIGQKHNVFKESGYIRQKHNVFNNSSTNSPKT